MEERIARMEKTLDKHSSQISKLFSRVDDTNACIQKIMNTLNQIRWTFFGALGYFAISEIGIIRSSEDSSMIALLTNVAPIALGFVAKLFALKKSSSTRTTKANDTVITSA